MAAGAAWAHGKLAEPAEQDDDALTAVNSEAIHDAIAATGEFRWMGHYPPPRADDDDVTVIVS